MKVAPGAPIRLEGCHQIELGPGQGAIDTEGEELAPQRLSLMVIHHQRVHDELPRHAEGELFVSQLSGIHDASKAEWSPGDGYGLPS